MSKIKTTDIDATGTRDNTTFLRGDDVFAIPAGSGVLVYTTTGESHRYWKVGLASSVNNYTSVAEFRFYLGTVPMTRSFTSTGAWPAQWFDDNNTTQSQPGTFGGRLYQTFDFGAPVAFDGFGIYEIDIGFMGGMAPGLRTIQHSDDGTTWTTIADTQVGTWTNNTNNLFTLAATTPVTIYLPLEQTPVGNGGKVLSLKTSEHGLEFIAMSGGGGGSTPEKQALVALNPATSGYVDKGYNISSVTKSSTGHYRVTFTIPFSDVNYFLAGHGQFPAYSDSNSPMVGIDRNGTKGVNYCDIVITDINNATPVDYPVVMWFQQFNTTTGTGGGGGSALTVTDGTHTETAVTMLTVTGAVVSTTGTGEATVTITGGGGSGTLAGLTDVEVTGSHSPTDGQALAWSAADSKWKPETISGGGGGGGRVLLQDVTIAPGNSSVPLTTLNNALYLAYEIEVYSIAGPSGNVSIRMSTDGGATYDTSGLYDWSAAIYGSGGYNTTYNGNSQGALGLMAYIPIGPNVGNLTAKIYSPGDTTVNQKHVTATSELTDPSGNAYASVGGGRYRNSAAVNALEIINTAGTFTQGRVRLYGIPITGGGGGGGGSSSPIFEVTLTAPAASITIPAISGTFTDLILAGTFLNTSTQDLHLQFNGDTAGHYYWYVENRFGNSSAASTTSMRCGATDTGIGGITEVSILDYKNSTNPKSVLYRGGYTSVPFKDAGMGQWSGIAPITSITLTPLSGVFQAGTTLSLTGR